MWPVGSAVVKMKRSMISHAMTTYQISNFPLAGRDRFEPRRGRGGVFVSMCRTRRVACHCNLTAAHVGHAGRGGPGWMHGVPPSR